MLFCAAERNVIWLVPAVLFAAGFIISVMAQGATASWLWIAGSVGGIVLMVVGGGLLAALLLMVAV